MGTLATVLAGKKIRTFQEMFKATITGDIEDVDGVLKITRINVHYFLKLPEEKKEDAIESLNNYLSYCPAAQSIMGCIDIKHKMSMENLHNPKGN
jgi:organic hydroperoxide reductase OsmC/OhrA